MSSQLPKMQTLDQLQTKWPAIIDPMLSNPTNNKSVLSNIKLVSGVNVVNHLLGRKLQGWAIVRRRQYNVVGTPTAYDIYDTQDSNQTPALTLVLTCNEGTQANPVIIDLEVY